MCREKQRDIIDNNIRFQKLATLTSRIKTNQTNANKNIFFAFAALVLTSFTRALLQASMTIDYIKSKIVINTTTYDSIKIFFGKPMQKKKSSHQDYYFDKLDNRLPATLSISFTGSIIKGSTTV